MVLSPLMQPVAQVCEVLHGLPAPWAICGGWAIDLWLDRTTRQHADVDVGAFRRDQGIFREHLQASGWTLSIARDGSESPWPLEACLELPDHAIWCRHEAATPGRFELLLNECDGSEFVFRRDPAMRMPLNVAFRKGPRGIPILSPAIVLLYKAKQPTPSDTSDFEAAASQLDEHDRDWLLRGIHRLAADHPWIGTLAA